MLLILSKRRRGGDYDDIAFRNCFTLEKLQWLGTAVYGCSKMGDVARAQFGPGNQLNAGCVL